MNEELQAKLLEYLQGAEQAITATAPEAYRIALEMVHLSGTITLGVGLALLVIDFVWGFAMFNLAKRLHKVCTDDFGDFESAAGFGMIAAGMAGGVGCVLFTMGALSYLLNVTAWIKFLNPEVGFMLDIYYKVFGG